MIASRSHSSAYTFAGSGISFLLTEGGNETQAESNIGLTTLLMVRRLQWITRSIIFAFSSPIGDNNYNLYISFFINMNL